VLRVKGQRIRTMSDTDAAYWLAAHDYQMGDTHELYNGNVVTYWRRESDGNTAEISTF
jgi:hypothetical protein